MQSLSRPYYPASPLSVGLGPGPVLKHEHVPIIRQAVPRGVDELPMPAELRINRIKLGTTQ